MEYVETYDAAIRARRTTRDKRAIGIVVASLIGAAAGTLGTTFFDHLMNKWNEEMREEMIENQKSLMQIVNEEIADIHQYEGLQWSTIYTLTAIIEFREKHGNVTRKKQQAETELDQSRKNGARNTGNF